MAKKRPKGRTWQHVDNELKVVLSGGRAQHCDGCLEPIPAGTYYLTGIRSCCGGGCVRSLCTTCIDQAALALLDKRARKAARA